MIDLLPCPHCGAAPTIVKHGPRETYVVCVTPFCAHEDNYVGDEDAWNRRSALAQPDAQAQQPVAWNAGPLANLWAVWSSAQPERYVWSFADVSYEGQAKVQAVALARALNAHPSLYLAPQAQTRREVELEAALRSLTNIAEHVVGEISWQPPESGGDELAWQHGVELADAIKNAIRALAPAIQQGKETK